MMYFSGITLNIMSLAGLALGIGMLVDNSIVVIENVYRLRGRGIDPARASVQGARQVQGPILASTLTTVCVFLPMIFTTGYTRQLMLPFALTITYALVASLLVSLTVVPTMSSVMLRKTKERSHRFFDKVLGVYEKVLSFCLRVKIVPLLIAIALLAFSVVEVIRMGVVMIPDIGSDQITVSMTLADDIKEQGRLPEGGRSDGRHAQGQPRGQGGRPGRRRRIHHDQLHGRPAGFYHLRLHDPPG